MNFDSASVKRLETKYGVREVQRVMDWIESHKPDADHPDSFLETILSKNHSKREDLKGAPSGESKSKPSGAFRLDGSWDASSTMNPTTRTLSSLAWMRRAGTLPPKACLAQIQASSFSDAFSPAFLSALDSESSWFTVKCSRSSEIFLRHAGRGRSTASQDELDVRDLAPQA